MTLLNAKEIVKRIRSLSLDEAAHFVLDLANQGVIPDPDKDPSPLTPSGAIPVYLKPNKKKKRRKKPGRKKVIPANPAKFLTISINRLNMTWRPARIARLP